MRNPIQPVIVDEDGILRFRRNVIVCALLEKSSRHGLDLNELAKQFCDDEYADDRRQLAQLIGYSLSGFGGLSYVDDETYSAAEAMAEARDGKLPSGGSNG